MKAEKTTFALFFGNRGFFPASLQAAARKEMTEALRRHGHKTIALDPKATRYGAVETPAEGERYAAFLRANRGKLGGVIVCLPNFGDGTGAVATTEGAGFPLLVAACTMKPLKNTPKIRMGSLGVNRGCFPFSLPQKRHPEMITGCRHRCHTIAPCRQIIERTATVFAHDFRTRQLGVSAMECWPAFQKALGFVPCYVSSALPSLEVPTASDVDEYNVVSKRISHLTSKERRTTAIADCGQGKRPQRQLLASRRQYHVKASNPTFPHRKGGHRGRPQSPSPSEERGNAGRGMHGSNVGEGIDQGMSRTSPIASRRCHRRHCFVAMPYGRTVEEVRWFRGWYEVVIKPAVLAAGLEPILSSSEEQPTAINDEIRRHLALDPMVVIDLGGVQANADPNPNVMYEMGIRHALDLPLVVMAWKGQALPLNVGNLRAIVEGRELLDLDVNKARLVNFIEAALAGHYYRPMDTLRRAV